MRKGRLIIESHVESRSIVQFLLSILLCVRGGCARVEPPPYNRTALRLATTTMRAGLHLEPFVIVTTHHPPLGRVAVSVISLHQLR